MRLDKYLAQAGIGTRSEVKKLIRCGRVLLNGAVAKKAEEKVSEDDDIVVDGEKVTLVQFQYFMLNKPAGVVSATTDRYNITAVEYISIPHVKELFPVGRLDKDTEGLLLLSNDGALAHKLLSPGNHVEKTYFVRVRGRVTEEDVEIFREGMDIGDEKITKPARLENLQYITLVACEEEKREEMLGFVESYFSEETLEAPSENEILTELHITITEGRYHQIKRMFAKINKPVQYLRRISMGSLRLDSSLGLGEYRELTEQELAELKKCIGDERNS